ncbi:uncharacterized protein LOC128657397 isoform X3 [Bombina bombina]|uniref:uncharacterized protein LOC128657397 isoform X3 n=1 Tax=Bombina bombina TaxID=8345 RepID=UPI00235A72CE|nr:uncharacterized protein LOC128657397 isoform X3 [Bombina bombina]
MSDKTKNQTSDLPDAHRDKDYSDVVKDEIIEDLVLTCQVGDQDEETSDSISSDEDNTDIVTFVITEDLCERQQLGAKDEETRDDIRRDEDKADIVKAEITEDLCVRQQLGATDETRDIIKREADNADVVKVEITEDQVKIEEDEVPINTATGHCSNQIGEGVGDSHCPGVASQNLVN